MMAEENVSSSYFFTASSSAPISSFDADNVTELSHIDIIYNHCFAALMVDRVVTPLWYFVGITGNIISAFVWLRPRMRKNSSSAIYLAALSINDTVFLLLHPLQELKYAWFVRSVDFPVVCESYAMFFLDTQYLAPVIVLAFSVDRFIAVCHPFKKEKYCTVKRAVWVVVTCVVLCMALGAIQPYLWTFNGTECTVREEAQVGGNRSLWSIWSWISELLVFLLVPLLVLVFNLLVILEMRRISVSGPQSDRANVRHLSSGAAANNAMLLLVSFYVIFTTLPATIAYALAFAFPEGEQATSHAQIDADPVWSRHLVYTSFKKIVDEVCLSHYACNVFMFAATGRRFRNSVGELLRLRRTKETETNSTFKQLYEQDTFISKV